MSCDDELYCVHDMRFTLWQVVIWILGMDLHIHLCGTAFKVSNKVADMLADLELELKVPYLGYLRYDCAYRNLHVIMSCIALRSS